MVERSITSADQIESEQDAEKFILPHATEYVQDHRLEFVRIRQLVADGPRAAKKLARERKRMRKQMRKHLVTAAGVPWWVRLLPLAARFLPFPWNLVFKVIAAAISAELMEEPE